MSGSEGPESRPPAAALRVDLHLHTTASDGHLPPRELVARARAAGLDILAVADHDTVAGTLEAMSEAPEGLAVLPAIEISATHPAGEQHILGYHIDPLAPSITGHATRAGTARLERMKEMIEALARVDVHVELHEVLHQAGPESGTLARPHLARTLVEKGYARGVSDAFARYLGDSGPAFVPTRLLDTAAAIEAIHHAGGVAVWAHPPLGVFERELDGLVETGLDGLECLRPRYAQADTALLLGAAERRGLLVSGGSDWHGPWDAALGSFWVDAEQVAPLLRRGGVL